MVPGIPDHNKLTERGIIPKVYTATPGPLSQEAVMSKDLNESKPLPQAPVLLCPGCEFPMRVIDVQSSPSTLGGEVVDVIYVCNSFHTRVISTLKK